MNPGVYAYLRYVLLLNIMASLLPCMGVKGRANDPLRHAGWWTLDQHSAVLVVAIAAVLGSVGVFLLSRANIRSWWAFIGCGILVGVFPALFYLIATPQMESSEMPLAPMFVVGAFSGTIAGIMPRALLAKRKSVDGAQAADSGR